MRPTNNFHYVGVLEKNKIKAVGLRIKSIGLTATVYFITQQRGNALIFVLSVSMYVGKLTPLNSLAAGKSVQIPC